MSHSGQLNSGTSGAGPIDTLTPDTGGVVTPVLNNINVNGTNGIQTSNGGAGVLIITDTLVSVGTATTIGNTTETLISIPLAADQSIMIQCIITVYETTLPAAFSAQVLGGVYRPGAAAAQAIPSRDPFTSETAGLLEANIDIGASGNNAIVTVTGQTGLTMNWRGAAFYITTL